MTDNNISTATYDITFDRAVCNAARLLDHAEMETNLALVERLDSMADSWLHMASLLHQRERDT